MLKLPKRLHPEFKRPNIKPEGPFVLDTNNPIVDRLQHCFVVDGNSIVDLVTGRRIKTSSYTKTKHSIFGGELQVTTDDQYLADYFDIDRFDGNGDFSVVFRATTRNQGAVADISTVLELGAKTGTAKGYLHIQQHTRDAGSGVPGSYYFATYANYGTTASYVSGPGAPDYKRWDNAAFVRDGNNLIGYTDGAERYNNYFVSKRNIFYGAGGRIKLLQGQSTFQPSFSYLYVFTRALSPAEVKSLNDDPYQILKPANDLYYFSPVGGGGPTTYTVTGSLAAVLQKQGLTKTATLNAILKKQGLTLSSSIDAMLLKVVALTSDVDAILQKQDVTKAATLAAVLQKQGVTGATTVSAVLQNQGVGVSSVLDAILQANPTISADLSALLQKTISLTGVIDAILQKTVTAGVSLDAILTSAGSGLTSATLDAILRKTAALSGTLDALLQRQGNTATATLNALLLKQQTKTATLNAILFGSATIAASLDSLLKKSGLTITASLGAILTVSGAFVAPKNIRYVMGDDRVIEIAADDRIIEVD